MKLEKNWFYYFSVTLAMIGMLYILVCGFVSLGAGQEYPYIPKGLLLLGLFASLIIVWLLAALSARLKLDVVFSDRKKWMRWGEVLFVVAILGLAVLVRLIVIREFPMKPASDYKTYYEIAELLTKGTIQKEGKGYCNYIAMFPHVMGYCYILMLLFKAVGVSVLAGQYLNIFFSVATVFIVYRIARKLGGRIAGMVALLLCAFWPSQILYITMLSAEYAFTFFFFVCVWLLVSLVVDYDGYTEYAGKAIFLHLLLGVLLALTAAIRPMALILLIAVVLTIAPCKMPLPSLPLNDIPLTVRFLERGWVRCVMIFVPYMILSSVITSNIELTVDRTLPSATTSFGYNLLVGLNTESKGGWNDEDAALLYSSMEETGSASQAHIACRDLAFQRVLTNPQGIFNLFIEKYELLWGNDDYGATWNIMFLQEQGNLTQERQDFLYQVRDVNDILYIITVFFALIGLIYIWRGKANLASLLSLVYLGTVAMHLLVESQNRYHYFVLQIFMILAAMAVQFLFADEKKKSRVSQREKELQIEEKKYREEKLLAMEKEEEQVVSLRKEAFENVFDMEKALKEGHIVMTVSEVYGQIEEKQTETGEIPEETEEVSKAIEEVAEAAEEVPEATEEVPKAIEEVAEAEAVPEEEETVPEAEEEPEAEAQPEEDWRYSKEELEEAAEDDWSQIRLQAEKRVTAEKKDDFDWNTIEAELMEAHKVFLQELRDDREKEEKKGKSKGKAKKGLFGKNRRVRAEKQHGK